MRELIGRGLFRGFEYHIASFFISIAQQSHCSQYLGLALDNQFNTIIVKNRLIDKFLITVYNAKKGPDNFRFP